MSNNIKQKIENTFHQEFSIIADKFNIIHLNAEEADKSEDKEIWKPGVYVFWVGDNVIKVGRSFDNSRKRALQHIKDNTSKNKIEMKDIFNLNDNS